MKTRYFWPAVICAGLLLGAPFGCRRQQAAEKPSGPDAGPPAVTAPAAAQVTSAERKARAEESEAGRAESLAFEREVLDGEIQRAETEMVEAARELHAVEVQLRADRQELRRLYEEMNGAREAYQAALEAAPEYKQAEAKEAAAREKYLSARSRRQVLPAKEARPERRELTRASRQPPSAPAEVRRAHGQGQRLAGLDGLTTNRVPAKMIRQDPRGITYE